jgi:hypothetical protein
MVNRQRSTGPALLTALALLCGCSGKNTGVRADRIPEKIPDSVLAKSKLPNANGVGAALRLQDTAAARRAREDSIARVIP